MGGCGRGRGGEGRGESRREREEERVREEGFGGGGGVQGRVLKRFFGDRGEVLSIARALTLEEVRRT